HRAQSRSDQNRRLDHRLRPGRRRRRRRDRDGRYARGCYQGEAELYGEVPDAGARPPAGEGEEAGGGGGVKLGRDDPEPVTHRLSYPICLFWRDNTHVTYRVSQMWDNARLLDKCPVAN